MTTTGLVFFIVLLICLFSIAVFVDVSNNNNEERTIKGILIIIICLMIAFVAVISVQMKSSTRISPQVIVTTTDGISDTTFIYRRK